MLRDEKNVVEISYVFLTIEGNFIFSIKKLPQKRVNKIAMAKDFPSVSYKCLFKISFRKLIRFRIL
jgi:hypothetical protein